MNPRNLRILFISGATIWLIFFELAAAVSWSILDSTHLPLGKAKVLGATGIIVPLLFCLASIAASEHRLRRAWISAVVTFFLVIFPMFFLSIYFSFLYFFITPIKTIEYCILVAAILTIIFFSARDFIKFYRETKDKEFFKKNYHFSDDEIVLNVNERGRSSFNSLALSIIQKAGWWMISLIPFVYFLQRAAFVTNGSLGLSVVLSTVCFPLTLYFSGQLVCGAYFYVIMSRSLERRYRQSVVFPVAG